MWKRNLVPTVAELPASKPEPTRSRFYDIISISTGQARYLVKEKATQNIIYTVLLVTDVPGWSIILTTGDPDDPNATASAAANVSHKDPKSHVVLGDPTSDLNSRQSIDLKLMELEEPKFNHYDYAISLPLPPARDGSEKVLDTLWRNPKASDISGFAMKADRMMHRDLVDVGTGRLLARYLHSQTSMGIAGSVEIFADVEGVPPLAWDLFVLTSGLAVTERTLQLIKWGVSRKGLAEAWKFGWRSQADKQRK